MAGGPLAGGAPPRQGGTRTTEVLVGGLCFPEGPRWHGGRLWFSAFYSHTVHTHPGPDAGASACLEAVAQVPGQPSGLGFMPDGTALVVSMLDRRLLRIGPGGALTQAADLSALAPSHCNDMVVDAAGRAYVGNFGFDRRAGQDPCSTCLVRADPDGSVRPVADGLLFPNGMAITPHGGTLIVAETYGQRLTAFDLDARGGAVKSAYGICLDVEGAIWIADPKGGGVHRVCEGGAITEQIGTVGRGAYACMLGGEDRRTLFVCTNDTSGPATARLRSGRIEFIRVDVAGAGLP
eukprot:gene4644-845_t